MQIRNAPAVADGGDLLACRMAMFGLDRDTLVNTDKYAFAEILRRCVNCTFRSSQMSMPLPKRHSLLPSGCAGSTRC